MTVDPNYVALRVGRCRPYCVLRREHLQGNCLHCGLSCAQGGGDLVFADEEQIPVWARTETVEVLK